ncbi:peptidoglycan binding domain-containing protein [uncultured Anaerococcus sp.]|uniref:L,D-transpeptidase family protein n=1 Tax=uncultured Anaerococcus sp. TaxID=293428 RepID=UPI0025F1F8D8|nr:peptidoglycan binding domain-containing protein [uncultured Anaerococcus sp.]
MTETNNNKNGKRIGLIILSIVVAIYLIGTIIFSNIALPGTYLNGKDISYASKKEAIASAPEDFSLNVSGRSDKSFKINPADIDYKAEVPKDAKIDQNPFTWPSALLSNKKQKFDVDYKVFYDRDKLDKVIDSSSMMSNFTEPENAKIAMKDGDFYIEKEVSGDKIDKEKLKKAIIDNINTKSNDLVLDDSYYVNPELTSDSKQIQDALADAQSLKDMSIKFNFNGFDLKLEGDSLLDLFDMNDEGPELNYDKVYEYAKYLASETDTYGKNRKFNATGIGEIVVGPGVYGFRLDVDGMVDKIYEQINSRQSGDIEPVYDNIAFVRTETGEDIGDTYVEVDISRQHLWFYKNGSLILESDLVSGRPVDGWASNVGVGQILNKAANTKLRGLNFDGQTSYETPVDYWMPIGWDGEGFHDAPWRSAFGGQLYLQRGSHGCYNLPPSVAKTLFENVDYLTPVVVYESSTNNSPAMAY